jgi:receptor protein-tyrosine kinase
MMITSAVPGEGKTFTSLNLCMSFAREQDWSVVLVDGDIHNPSLSRALGIERDRGLLDVLRDPSLDFPAHVMPTSIPRLAVLPAGTRGDDASELIGSARMDKMLAELAAEDPKRLIVFDTAPLLVSAETPILASLMGQTVFVVLAGKTPRRATMAALERLDRAKPINLLLNQASPKHEPGAYGETYGYGA